MFSGDVDIDRDRRVVPKLWLGDGRGDTANDARLCSLTGDGPFFLIVVIANGDMPSIIA